MLGRVRDIRRGGSAALDLCHIAAGHLDAYWELDLSPWDYAAGGVIAREAGAEVVLAAAGARAQARAVVAADPALMPAFLDAAARGRRGDGGWQAAGIDRESRRVDASRPPAGR